METMSNREAAPHFDGIMNCTLSDVISVMNGTWTGDGYGMLKKPSGKSLIIQQLVAEAIENAFHLGCLVEDK